MSRYMFTDTYNFYTRSIYTYITYMMLLSQFDNFTDKFIQICMRWGAGLDQTRNIVQLF